ncbi:MAG: T9SS type A sorting domain-containing protein [Bacteroidota bacterium]
MKQTLPIFILLFFTTVLWGQSPISVSPTTYQGILTVDLTKDLLLQDPTVTITNTTDSVLALRWERFELNRPDAWETQVCDPNECYFPIVSSNVDTVLGLDAPMIIQPNSSANISIYVNPNKTSGTGTFALDFALVSQPDSIIGTANFEVEVANLVVNTLDAIRQQEVRVYPNPAIDYFQLTETENIDRVAIVNLVGRQVGAFRVFPGARYDVNYLPDGMYLVSLINDDYGVVKTMRLGKRALRP